MDGKDDGRKKKTRKGRFNDKEVLNGAKQNVLEVPWLVEGERRDDGHCEESRQDEGSEFVIELHERQKEDNDNRERELCSQRGRHAMWATVSGKMEFPAAMTSAESKQPMNAPEETMAVVRR